MTDFMNLSYNNNGSYGSYGNGPNPAKFQAMKQLNGDLQNDGLEDLRQLKQDNNGDKRAAFKALRAELKNANLSPQQHCQIKQDFMALMQAKQQGAQQCGDQQQCGDNSFQSCPPPPPPCDPSGNDNSCSIEMMNYQPS